MEKLKQSFSAKLIAVILLCVFALTFALSAVGIFNADARGAYPGGSYEYYMQKQLNERAYNLSRSQLACIIYGYEQDESADFLYICLEDGEVIRSKGDIYNTPLQVLTVAKELQNNNIVRGDAVYSGGKVMTEELNALIAENSEGRVLIGGIKAELSGTKLAAEMKLAGLLFRLRYVMIVTVVLSFALGVLLFIFLLGAAGHKAGVEGIKTTWLDRLPYDAVFLVLFSAFWSFAVLCFTVLSGGNIVLCLLAAVLLYLLAGLTLLLLCMTTAVRIKRSETLKNTLCGRLLAFIIKPLKALTGKNAPMLWKYIVLAAALLALELITVVVPHEGETRLLFWVIERAALLGLFFTALLGFKRIKQAAKTVAAGGHCAIDTADLRWDLLDMAEDLNSIEAGLKKAVDERMKSEHFKTELITNVSHDIKTPLTSIINYTDLLKKEEPENEKMREYIEVISRQSDKLKALIGDLIEASKASTGALSVEAVKTELGVLIEQAEGEYSEKLKAAGLELVCRKPDEPVYFMADGRHIWRIFDNLLVNILKYSQSGTRVYLSGEKLGGKAVFSFRNISAEELNIPADKLMERFVRGDSSRHSSGSGLGLSIANSLAELQGGKMELSIDGDLFKVTLSFDEI